MNDDLLTDAMVEAAAKAEWTHEWPIRPWEKTPDDLADHYRDCSRAALEAVAPLIAAKAWEEGYQACRNRPRVDGYLINRANPYQTRADRIERGES